MLSRVGRGPALAAVALLASQLILQINLSRADSQTTDEAIHLSAGYSYWAWGNYALNPEHPPLVKLLAGMSVWPLRPVLPPITHPERLSNFFYDSWFENRALGEAFLYGSGNDADRLLFYGRLPAILLTALLGGTIFFVAERFFGALGGAISVALYVLDPLVAAHGHLITTDIAVALGGVAVLAATWRFGREPDARSTVLLGLALGFASLAKFTSIVFLPIVLALLVATWGIRLFLRRLPRTIAAVLTAWFVILATYGFSLAPPPPEASVSTVVNQLNGHAVMADETLDRVYTAFRNVAIPRDYVKGLMLMLGHVAGGQEAFLLGRRSDHGWWYYFPIVFLTKTPLPTLLLLGLAIGIGAAGARDLSHWYWFVAAAAFFLMAMTSRANLGVRHVLPAQIFLFIWMGGLARSVQRRRGLALVVALLLAWLAVDFVRAHDRYLAFYNELVGDRGYFISVDSNLDWGQDLKRIRAYLDRHPEIERPYVEYPWDGAGSLDYYGIRHRPANDLTPATQGLLIIGATMLWDPRWDFVRRLPAADRITPGVFLYRLPGIP